MDDEFDIYNDLEEFDWQQKYLELSENLKEEQSKALTALNRISILDKEILKFEYTNESLKRNLAAVLKTFGTECKRKDGQIIQLRKEKDNICFRREPSTNFKIPKKPHSMSISTQTDMVFKISTTTQTTDSGPHEIPRQQNDKRVSERDGGKSEYRNRNNNNNKYSDLRDEIQTPKRHFDFNDKNSKFRTSDRFHGTSSKYEPRIIPEPKRNDRHFSRRNDERCDKRKWSPTRNNSRDDPKRGRFEKNQKEKDDDLMELELKLAKLREAIQSETWEPEEQMTEQLKNFINSDDSKQSKDDLHRKPMKSRRMSICVKEPSPIEEKTPVEIITSEPPLLVLSEDLQSEKSVPVEDILKDTSSAQCKDASSDDLPRKALKSRRMSIYVKEPSPEKIPIEENTPEENISNETPLLVFSEDRQQENKVAEVGISKDTLPEQSKDDLPKKPMRSRRMSIYVKEQPVEETVNEKKSSENEDLQKKLPNIPIEEKAPEENISTEPPFLVSSEDLRLEKKVPEPYSKQSKEASSDDLHRKAMRSRRMSIYVKEPSPTISMVPEENISTETLPIILSEDLRPEKKVPEKDISKNTSPEPYPKQSKDASSDDLHRKAMRSRRMSIYVKEQSPVEEKAPEENISTETPLQVFSEDLQAEKKVPEEGISKEPSTTVSTEDLLKILMQSKRMEKEAPAENMLKETSNETLLPVPEENISQKASTEQSESILIVDEVPVETKCTLPVSSEDRHKKPMKSMELSEIIPIEGSILKDELPLLDFSEDPHKKPMKSRREQPSNTKERSKRRGENKVSENDSKKSKDSSLEPSLENSKKSRIEEILEREESKLPERSKKSKMSRRMSIYFGDDSLTEEPIKEPKNVPENHSDINLIINKKTGKVRRSSECIPIPEQIDEKKREESTKNLNLEEVPEAKLSVPELPILQQIVQEKSLGNEFDSEAVKLVEKVLPKISEILIESKEADNTSKKTLKKSEKQEENENRPKTNEEPQTQRSEKSRKTEKVSEKSERARKDEEKTKIKIPDSVIELEKISNSSEEKKTSKTSSRRHKPESNENFKKINLPETKITEPEKLETKTQEKLNKKSSRNRKSSEKPEDPSKFIKTAASRKSFDPELELPVLHSILKSPNTKTPAKNKKVRISDEFSPETQKPVSNDPPQTFSSIADLLNTPMKPEILRIDEKILPVNEEVIFLKSRKRSSNKRNSKNEELKPQTETVVETVVPTTKSNKNNSKQEEDKEEVTKATNQILKSIENNSEDVVCPSQKETVIETVVPIVNKEKIISNGSYTILEVIGNETVILLNRKRKKKNDKK